MRTAFAHTRDENPHRGGCDALVGTKNRRLAKDRTCIQFNCDAGSIRAAINPRNACKDRGDRKKFMRPLPQLCRRFVQFSQAVHESEAPGKTPWLVINFPRLLPLIRTSRKS